MKKILAVLIAATAALFIPISFAAPASAAELCPISGGPPQYRCVIGVDENGCVLYLDLDYLTAQVGPRITVICVP